MRNHKDTQNPPPYRAPNPLIYFLINSAFRIISRVLYHPQVLRNEIKNLDGPFVIIANHQSSLDIVNLSIQYNKHLVIVFSSNYYHSLPRIAQKMVDACGVIHKQQFQTKPGELRKMRRLIQQGAPILIYPAGMMCEDGLSTPIPQATASFIQFLGVDVYMARTTGSYFVHPKWSDKIRRGKTKMDIYRLFSKEELKMLSINEVQKKMEDALDFDAYAEQELDLFHYKNGDDTKGLENVVYHCPVCKSKHKIVSEGNRLKCLSCGFIQTMDSMGFLHCEDPDKEIRHVSSWTKWILSQREMEIDDDFSMTLPCEISIMDGSAKGFRPAGSGDVTLNPTSVILNGILDGKPCRIEKGVHQFPILPFMPGRRFEIQDNSKSYRCIPEDPKLVMEWINSLKILHKRCINIERKIKNDN